MITITYDPEADAIYVKVRDTAVSTTEDYSDAVKADFDSDERLVGVEILDVGAAS